MFKRRMLFWEISPVTYKISVKKCCFIRHIKNLLIRNLATEKSDNLLPYTIYKQNSLIRRKLGNVDPYLQDNKAINLNIAAPKISGVIIKPNQVFFLLETCGHMFHQKGL